MKHLLLILMLAGLSGCQNEVCTGSPKECEQSQKDSDASSLAVSELSAPAVTHCYRDAAPYPLYDYVILNHADGTQSISCSIILGVFTEYTAFAAYSPAQAGIANSRCHTQDWNNDGVDDWVFEYINGVATVTAENSLYNATLTCEQL